MDLTSEVNVLAPDVADEYDDPGPPAGDAADIWRALNAQLANIDGVAHADPLEVQVRYTPSEKHLLIPGYLVEGRQRIARELLAGDPADENTFQDGANMAHYQRLWAPEDVNHTWGECQNLTLRTVLAVAALNLAVYGGNPLAALLVAFALSVGLVNVGGDGLVREWVLTSIVPDAPSMKAVMDFYAKVCKGTAIIPDIIALVGYRRISRTHIYDSADDRQEASVGAVDLGIINRIIRQAGKQVAPYGANDQADLLYNCCHCFSLSGAVGFWRWWLITPAAGPLIVTRDNPLGDVWKPLAIATAGYDNLVALPIVGDALRLLQDERQRADRFLENVADNPWVTSSLSRLLCGDETQTCRMMNEHFVQFMSAMVAGAAEANYLSASLKTSHYVRRMKTKHSAAVTMWESVFSEFERRTRSLGFDAMVAGMIGGAQEQLQRQDQRGQGAFGVGGGQGQGQIMVQPQQGQQFHPPGQVPGRGQDQPPPRQPPPDQDDDADEGDEDV